jgi:hypothetical protein
MSHDDGSLSSPPGVYELCLFANDGFSRLATSPPFALGSRSFYNPYNAHVAPCLSAPRPPDGRGLEPERGTRSQAGA